MRTGSLKAERQQEGGADGLGRRRSGGREGEKGSEKLGGRCGKKERGAGMDREPGKTGEFG